MKGRKIPEEDDLVYKYAKRIFIGEKLKWLPKLIERLGLYDGLSDVIANFLESDPQDSDNPVSIFANQVFLHTNFPDNVFEGKKVSDEEQIMLTEFAIALWKAFIRKNYRFHNGIVAEISAEIKSICGIKGWDWKSIQPGITLLKSFEDDLRDLGKGDPVKLPEVDTKDDSRREPYLEWQGTESELKKLVNLLSNDRKWILEGKNLRDLLGKEVPQQIKVRCNEGFEYHLALFFYVLKKEGFYVSKVSNGYFNVLQNCLVTGNGTVSQKTLRQLPTEMKNSRMKHKKVIEAVRLICVDFGISKDAFEDCMRKKTNS